MKIEQIEEIRFSLKKTNFREVGKRRILRENRPPKEGEQQINQKRECRTYQRKKEEDNERKQGLEERGKSNTFFPDEALRTGELVSSVLQSRLKEGIWTEHGIEKPMREKGL